jgi:2-keto-3-deoxy-L-rhamnonate aldolase RhmA
MTTSFVWQRRKNRFKELIQAGETAIAMWLDVPWPPLVEILGACGGDAAFIDMEHTTNSFEDVENLIIAADAAGVTPIFRPAGLDPKAVGRALDSGAQGVIFPDIRTRAEAELAVASTKYPPAGQRGWGGSHTRYAMWEGLPAAAAIRETEPQRRGVYSREYVDKANADVLVFMIIESLEGMSNLDEILDVPGIDAVSFGWADYSVQMGFDLAKCEEASNRLYDACRSRGIGTSLSIGQAGKQEHYPGCYYIAGIDTLIISAAFRQTVADARRRVAEARSGANVR